MMGQRFMRPMDVGDMMDAAFRVYRARILTFLTIALVAYMPYALSVSLWQALIEPELTRLAAGFQTLGPSAGSPSIHPEQQEAAAVNAYTTEILLITAISAAGGHHGLPALAMLADTAWQGRPVFAQTGGGPDEVLAALKLMALLMMGMAINLLFIVVVDPLARAALVYNISGAYLGEELSAARAYRLALPRLPVLIVANIIAWIGILMGYCMMVVPGVLAQVWMLLLAPAILLEKRGPIEGIRRSYQLVRGNVARGFLLAAAVFLLSLLGALLVNLTVELLPIEHEAVKLFIVNVGNAALLPVTVGPAIFLYYDLRIRKEGMDLTMLEEAMQ